MRKQGLLIAALAAAGLAACASLSESDRALIASANKNAEDAKTQAARAADVAQQALDASRAAQSSAQQSAQAAQAANAKADRIFQSTLRK